MHRSFKRIAAGTLALLLVCSILLTGGGRSVRAEETHEVTFAFESEDRTTPLPEKVTQLTPKALPINDGESFHLSKYFEPVDDGDYAWEFVKYEPDYNGEAVRSDLHLVGLWKRVEKKTVSVEFVSSDPSVALPDELTKTEDEDPKGRVQKPEKYIPGKKAYIFSDLSTLKSGDYVWTFKSWSPNVKNGFLGSYYIKVSEDEEQNKAIGTWEPKRCYSVDYQFKSATGDALPEEVMKELPAKAGGHLEGEQVTPPSIPDVYTTKDGKALTWHLKEWNEAEHTMGASDFTFVGTWESYRSYTVTYAYQYEPADGDVPDALKEALPQPKPGYNNNEEVVGPTLEKTSYGSTSSANPGFWKIQGWETGRHIEADDLTLTGTWKFEPAVWTGTVTFDGYFTYDIQHKKVKVTVSNADEQIGYHEVWCNHPGFLRLPQYFVGWSPKQDADPSRDQVYLPNQTYREVFPNGLGGAPTLYDCRVNLLTMVAEVNNTKPYFNQYSQGEAGSATLPDQDITIVQTIGFDDPDAKEREIIAYYDPNLPDHIALNLNAGYKVPDDMANFTYMNPNNIFYAYGRPSSIYLNVDLDDRIQIADKLVDIYMKSYNFRPVAVMKGNVTETTGSGDSLVPVEHEVIQEITDAVKNNDPNSHFTSNLNGEHQFALKCLVRRQKPNNAWDDAIDPYKINATPEEIHQPMDLYTMTEGMFSIPRTDALANANGEADGFTVNGSIYVYMHLGRGSQGEKLDAVPLRITFRHPVVTFDPNGGQATGETETKVEKRTSISDKALSVTFWPTDPTRDGYDFVGWSTDKNAKTPNFTDKTVVNGDMTLYAIWKQKVNYSLSYDANGGNDAPAEQTASSTDDEYSFTVESGTPTRENYTFVGWAETDAATTATIKAGDTVTLPYASPTKTLYAVWKENVKPTSSTSQTSTTTTQPTSSTSQTSSTTTQPTSSTSQTSSTTTQPTSSTSQASSTTQPSSSTQPTTTNVPPTASVEPTTTSLSPTASVAPAPPAQPTPSESSLPQTGEGTSPMGAILLLIGLAALGTTIVLRKRHQS